jgi:predicted nucleotidyltransferase
MKIPLGIEGDYIETKETSLFFDVKGLNHPRDRKICYIRFIPDEFGDRLKEGIKYKKVYDLEERDRLITKKYPQYRFYFPEYDTMLQSVKNEDIKKIYSPRKYLNLLRSKSSLNNIEERALELCNLLSSEGCIPKDQIGITGSPMVGLNLNDSDIDLIIYGTKESQNFQKHLKSLISNSIHLRQYTLQEYEKHYEWRAGGSVISFDQFIRTEQRKLHQGKFYNKDFFIRYIKSPRDWKGNFYHYKFKDLGRISLIAKVLSNKDGLFTPCSYKINCEKIISSDSNLDKNQSELNEVFSYRGRFCEQAKVGERFLIDGKLEKVHYKGNIHYRVILTHQKLDKMVLMT